MPDKQWRREQRLARAEAHTKPAPKAEGTIAELLCDPGCNVGRDVLPRLYQEIADSGRDPFAGDESANFQALAGAILQTQDLEPAHQKLIQECSDFYKRAALVEESPKTATQNHASATIGGGGMF